MLDRLFERLNRARFWRAATEAVLTFQNDVHWHFLADQDLATDLTILKGFAYCARQVMFQTAFDAALGSLLVEQTPRSQDVDIREITALTCSKGRYVANLDRLAKTISSPPEHVCFMSFWEQMQLLLRIINNEGLIKDSSGRFLLDEEGWSGRLIAANTGAARRFSLLRQLSEEHPTILQASITRWDLRVEAVRVICQDYIALIVPETFACHFRVTTFKHFMKDFRTYDNIFSRNRPEACPEVEWTMMIFPRTREALEFANLLKSTDLQILDFSNWVKSLAQQCLRFPRIRSNRNSAVSQLLGC